MSLFPAYAHDSNENKPEYKERFPAEPCHDPLYLEAQLLESDNEEGQKTAEPPCIQSQPEQQDYYLDCKLDFGNLRVSTLYYPGRPQYVPLSARSAVGARGRRGGGAGRGARYFSAAHHADRADHADHADAERLQRTRAYRDMLQLNPNDEALWLQFIEFQEVSRDAEAALAAASEAAARLPSSRRVRAALHRARAAALPPHRRLELLRDELRAAAAPRTELWLRLLAAAAAGGAAAVDAAAAAALPATRSDPLAYPHILYAYGGYLRAAGLWEKLVLLLELVTSMNFPPTAFPPPVDRERQAERERHLQELEDKIMSSGLPLSTVWVRVERARAAAHWRPAGAGEGSGAGAGADPQRAPQPADVAELLLPVADADAATLLLVQALRLAKVPLLPCSEYALSAVEGANDALGDACEADGAELLLALHRAARRLPPAHPARAPPAPAARLLARLLDPPHYFSDDYGYLSWVTALWDACCEWTAGERRTALLCWRLRWLHALLLLLDTQEEAGRTEARRVRGEARAALKRFADSSPLAFAQFARIEHAAGDAAAGRRAALHAVRAALRSAAPPHCLYVARVLAELCPEPGLEPCAAWATACAALGRALPPDADLCRPPPPELMRDALLQCETQCSLLETEVETEARGGGVVEALLPAPAEWAAARARLASPARRADLVRQLCAAPHPKSWEVARYREQSACALVVAAAREHRGGEYARALALHFPHSALLALASGGAAPWAWDARASPAARLRALAGGARSHRAALAHALPALWRGEARAAARCARLARGGAGGALLAAARVEAERSPAALCAALAAQPQHKWVCVRGAAWCGAEAPALADVLLERQMRAHALLDELAPPPL